MASVKRRISNIETELLKLIDSRSRYVRKPIARTMFCLADFLYYEPPKIDPNQRISFAEAIRMVLNEREPFLSKTDLGFKVQHLRHEWHKKKCILQHMDVENEGVATRYTVKDFAEFRKDAYILLDTPKPKQITPFNAIIYRVLAEKKDMTEEEARVRSPHYRKRLVAHPPTRKCIRVRGEGSGVRYDVIDAKKLEEEFILLLTKKPKKQRVVNNDPSARAILREEIASFYSYDPKKEQAVIEAEVNDFRRRYKDTPGIARYLKKGNTHVSNPAFRKKVRIVLEKEVEDVRRINN